MNEIIARHEKIGTPDVFDVVIVGGGPAGIAATLAAKEKQLRYLTFEQDSFGGTVARYPRGKLVMTRTAHLPLYGKVRLRRVRKERLLALWQKDGLMVSELGNRLFLDSGTLTPLLKRLEAAGLITRLRAVQDERRVHITLTAAGRQLKAQAAKIPGCIISATECSLPELKSLTKQLGQLRTALARNASGSKPQS